LLPGPRNFAIVKYHVKRRELENVQTLTSQ
jgi:hypothetical protein